MLETLVNTVFRGGGKLLNILFSVSYEEKRNPARKYKVYKILFLKFKFNTVYQTNKVYKLDKIGNKRLITNRKELFKYLKNVTGENNTIVLPDTELLNFFIIEMPGSNNIVEIKGVERCSNITIDVYGDNSSILIDNVKYFVNAHLRIDGNSKKIMIGKDCMFSYGINIWTGDGHPIYDLTTGERINEDQDVIIGNHVWMGRNVSVHKGGVIPDGCVIGANSFVTKKFYESNCMIAGTPARTIKKNIRWEC